MSNSSDDRTGANEAPSGSTKRLEEVLDKLDLYALSTPLLRNMLSQIIETLKVARRLKTFYRFEHFSHCLFGVFPICFKTSCHLPIIGHRDSAVIAVAETVVSPHFEQTVYRAKISQTLLDRLANVWGLCECWVCLRNSGHHLQIGRLLRRVEMPLIGRNMLGRLGDRWK